MRGKDNGMYLNIGNSGFDSVRRSGFVDKTDTIAFMNGVLNTEHRYVCVTRARRFGKSITAKMLCAYYDQSCDSRALFQDLKIAIAPSYEQNLNQFPVLYLDMTSFTARYHGEERVVERIQSAIAEELQELYPSVEMKPGDDLMNMLVRIADYTKQKFICIIDEWDAICREAIGDNRLMDSYVDMLRRLFKGPQSEQVFAGVYMTGIFPIKKYNTESALNNFVQYTMVSPGPLAGNLGFTIDEVEALCESKGLDFEEVKTWYDGYTIGQKEGIFNPNSVMLAALNGYCDNYWGSTGAYERVSNYIQLNYDGLKDDVVRMLTGERCLVNISRFENDFSLIKSKNDVLTALIHLGYLAYDAMSQTCFIPNEEVRQVMQNAVEDASWTEVVRAIQQSEHLLQMTLDGNAAVVAKMIDEVHADNTSVLKYNDENSLACVLSLAYYTASKYYTILRELPAGLGFADLVMLPKRNVQKPALVIELKWDKTADSAITQIKEKRYERNSFAHADEVLLVGINYDKKTKQHSCEIERIVR